MLRFLDIAKTPDGSLVLITKTNCGTAHVSYITRNSSNPKVAWWEENDLEVLGNIYSLLEES